MTVPPPGDRAALMRRSVLPGAGRRVRDTDQRRAAATMTTTSSSASRPDMIRFRVFGSTL
ncbi:hypothetical protein GCM10017688_10540 [Streptomyces ramulosus]